jgi:hypothetical protein
VLLTEFDEPVLADFSAAVTRDEQSVVGVHETTALNCCSAISRARRPMSTG